MTTAIATKACVGCHLELALEEFPPQKGKKDGRRGRCRPCYRQYQRDLKARQAGKKCARCTRQVAYAGYPPNPNRADGYGSWCLECHNAVAKQTSFTLEWRRRILAQPAPEPEAEPAPIVSGDWRNRAACRDEDPELFFPLGSTGPFLLQIDEAKAVCRRCPVMAACLQWALKTGQDAGVLGGMSEDERKALKRRAARNRARATA